MNRLAVASLVVVLIALSSVPVQGQRMNLEVSPDRITIYDNITVSFRGDILKEYSMFFYPSDPFRNDTTPFKTVGFRTDLNGSYQANFTWQDTWGLGRIAVEITDGRASVSDTFLVEMPQSEIWERLQEMERNQDTRIWRVNNTMWMSFSLALFLLLLGFAVYTLHIRILAFGPPEWYERGQRFVQSVTRWLQRQPTVDRVPLDPSRNRPEVARRNRRYNIRMAKKYDGLVRLASENVKRLKERYYAHTKAAQDWETKETRETGRVL
jgi:hypothetical protein